MRFFVTALENFAFLGIEKDKTSQKYVFNKKNRIAQILCVECISLTLLFLIYDANSFIEYTEALFILSSAILCGVVYISLYVNVKVFFKFFESCDNVANMRKKNAVSKKIHDDSIRQVEKWSKIITFLSRYVIAQIAILSRLIPTFFFYYVADLGSEAFVLPVPMWFPFDWKNPVGYLIAVTIQFSIAFYGFVLFAALGPLALGAFLIALAGAKDMKEILHNIIKYAKMEDNLTRMLKELSEFIEFHSGIKQAIKYFSEVFQPIIATLFSWSLVTMTGAMLMIQVETESHNETDLFVIIVMLIEVVCAFGLVGFSCELGQRFSTGFDDINDLMDQFKWYSFPIEVQRMLPIVILIVQQPVAIECFGSILCVRAAFKSVTKTAFSYFMVLRIYL